MAGHMKTTVQISDALLADVKKVAAKRNTTLKTLVDEGLRLVVANEQKTQSPYRLKDCSVGGNGLHPDVAGKSWKEILALSYGDRGGEGL